MASDTDDDLTEMTDMTAVRVDAVKGAANGATFLLVKALADPAVQVEIEDAVAKAEESTAAQNDLPDADFAYIEPGGSKDADGKTTPRSKRHFPVHDAAHVRNALARAGDSPFGEKAMPKIKAAAKRLGVKVDGEMAKGGPVGDGIYVLGEGGSTHCAMSATPVVDEVLRMAKARQIHVTVNGATLTDDAIARHLRTALQTEGVIAKADGIDPAPGSAEWEIKDSATLHNAAQMLAQVNALLETAQDREEAELDAGAEDGYGDICDLGQAMCCLNEALSIVGRLVYTEAAEALTAGDGMAKAGRRLSAKSEAALKATLATLTALLAGDSKPSSTPKDNNTTEGAAGTDEEDIMNDEQLAKALKDNNAELATAITAGLGDLIKGLLPTQATDATTPPATGTEAPLAKATDPAVVAASDPNEALVKGLADAFKAAVNPLEERLAKMEATPRRGVGPLATVPRGGASTSDIATTVRDLLAKAEAAHNPDQAQQYRNEASMLSLSVGHQTGKFFDPGRRVSYDMPSSD